MSVTPNQTSVTANQRPVQLRAADVPVEIIGNKAQYGNYAISVHNSGRFCQSYLKQMQSERPAPEHYTKKYNNIFTKVFVASYPNLSFDKAFDTAKRQARSGALKVLTPPKKPPRVPAELAKVPHAESSKAALTKFTQARDLFLLANQRAIQNLMVLYPDSFSQPADRFTVLFNNMFKGISPIGDTVTADPKTVFAKAQRQVFDVLLKALAPDTPASDIEYWKCAARHEIEIRENTDKAFTACRHLPYEEAREALKNWLPISVHQVRSDEENLQNPTSEFDKAFEPGTSHQEAGRIAREFAESLFSRPLETDDVTTAPVTETQPKSLAASSIPEQGSHASSVLPASRSAVPSTNSKNFKSRILKTWSKITHKKPKQAHQASLSTGERMTAAATERFQILEQLGRASETFKLKGHNEESSNEYSRLYAERYRNNFIAGAARDIQADTSALDLAAHNAASKYAVQQMRKSGNPSHIDYADMVSKAAMRIRKNMDTNLRPMKDMEIGALRKTLSDYLNNQEN